VRLSGLNTEVSLLRHYLRAGLEAFTQQLPLPATYLGWVFPTSYYPFYKSTNYSHT
jgi:hypothetical protein